MLRPSSGRIPPLKGMEFHVLLLVDNAGGHPVELDHEGVQIEFLPPNTTSLLQPMDQGGFVHLRHLTLGAVISN